MDKKKKKKIVGKRNWWYKKINKINKKEACFSSALNTHETYRMCSHVAIAHLRCFNCEYSHWLFFLQAGISTEHCHSYNCVFIFLKTNHIATVLTGLDEQSVTEHNVDKNQWVFFFVIQG